MPFRCWQSWACKAAGEEMQKEALPACNGLGALLQLTGQGSAPPCQLTASAQPPHKYALYLVQPAQASCCLVRHVSALHIGGFQAT